METQQHQQIDPGKLVQLETLTLEHGSHETRDDGMCVMEAVALLDLPAKFPESYGQITAKSEVDSGTMRNINGNMWRRGESNPGTGSPVTDGDSSGKRVSRRGKRGGR